VKSSLLLVGAATFLGFTSVFAQADDPDLKLFQDGKTKRWITIPRSEVRQMPAWTPYSGEKVPVSLGDAWRYIHAEASPLATASPFWTNYVELVYEPGREQNWFYRFHFNYAVIKDQTMCYEELTYIVLMDGSYVTNLDETREAAVPPSWKMPNLHPEPKKPVAKALPDNVELIKVTTAHGRQSAVIPYSIPRAQFLALPPWSFYSSDPPPVSLDQALDIVRKNVRGEWPGDHWKFGNIQLVHGKGPATFDTCFYAFTVSWDSPAPGKELSIISLQLVLMDGSLIDVDPAQIASMATRISW
jgi:hypothetical protein